jgi:hypothetical protein
MSEPKTRPTHASVPQFLDGVADPARRQDCQEVLEMMRRVTGSEPKMWGSGMIGFGQYRYKYESGREGDWPLAGFSPRKENLTLYIMAGVERYPALLQKLGKHKVGKGCLYVKKLSDVDKDVLEQLVRSSVEHVRERYGDAAPDSTR